MDNKAFYKGMLHELNKLAMQNPPVKPPPNAGGGAPAPNAGGAPPIKPAPISDPNPRGMPGAFGGPMSGQQMPKPAPEAGQPTGNRIPYFQNSDGTPIDNPRGFFRSRANLPADSGVDTGKASYLDEGGPFGWGKEKAQQYAASQIDAAMQNYGTSGQMDTSKLTPEEINTLKYSDWAKKYVLDKSQALAHSKLTNPETGLMDLSSIRPEDPKSMPGQIFNDLANDPTRRDAINKDLGDKTYGLAGIDRKGQTDISPTNFQGQNFLKDHWGKILMALLGVGGLGMLMGGRQQEAPAPVINNYVGMPGQNQNQQPSHAPSFF